MKSRLFLSLVLILGVFSFSKITLAQDSKTGLFTPGYQFALIGDAPYGIAPGETNTAFDRLTDDINADRNVRWVLHAGDIKAGSTPCSDEWFLDRKDRFDRFNKPFILTLGDNEWTDCHRVKAGEYAPLERLAKLREIFFPITGLSLGQRKIWMQSQAFFGQYRDYPENLIWSRQGVQFATIHLVGSNNGLAPFDPNSSVQRTAADDQEVSQREAAGLFWLDYLFDRAESKNAPGVFLMVHANPALEFRADPSRLGFEAFLSQLEKRVQEFGKPVVLAHGDSHYFRIDKPKLDAVNFLPNFTRVETFGASRVHWVRVIVKPRSKQVFSFQEEIVGGN